MRRSQPIGRNGGAIGLVWIGDGGPGASRELEGGWRCLAESMGTGARVGEVW